MNKVENYLVDSLNRINFIFNNREIKTKCVKDFKAFTVLGETFGPYEKGENYKIRLFDAKPLIEKNILKVVPNEFYTNIDVQRYAISERDNQKLVLRDNQYFLNKIKESKCFVEKEVLDGAKPKVDLDRFSSYSINIIDSRLLKLLRLAKSELSMDDNRRLSDSEKILYNQFYNLIKIWRNFYLNSN